MPAPPKNFRGWAIASGLSFIFFQFGKHLSFQMPSRRFLDRAALRCDRLLFGFAFSPASFLERLWQMRNLRPLRAYFSLFWFCVRIHRNLALLVRDKKNGKSGKLKND
jgi:hypothetical protein